MPSEPRMMQSDPWVFEVMVESPSLLFQNSKVSPVVHLFIVLFFTQEDQKLIPAGETGGYIIKEKNPT